MAAAGNNPGSRLGASGWTDGDGNFWLFGGESTLVWDSADFSTVDQYDLWEYNASSSEWAWMGGNNTLICSAGSSGTSCNQDGVTGTKGVPSIANIPASRDGATSWIDASDNLWLFGGEHLSTTYSFNPGYFCNDMWQFDPSADEWGFINGTSDFTFDGDNCIDFGGSWGVKGLPAISNIPSGGAVAASWTDLSGNFWVFGGVGWTQVQEIADLNDLWVYKPVPAPPAPSFEVIASPNPINAAVTGPGIGPVSTVTTTINILTADRFDSPVTLTATPLTTNGVTAVTGSFSPSTITGTGSSQLTVSLTAAELVGVNEIWLTVTATSGSISQSIVVVVVVTAAGQINPPVFSPAPGTYPPGQVVTITSAYYNTYVYYTKDGTTPTVSSPVYANPITLTATTTLQAFALETPFDTSGIVSGIYTIAPPASTPTFSPVSGTYDSAQSVTIADATPGATLYYTTDGTAPTTSSTVYSGPIPVASTETVEAIATASGYTASAVGSANYTIVLPTATPTFSPAGGTYSSVQSVSVADTTAGATIYYTTDGTTPTASSTVYSGPIAVSATESLAAIATASGYSTSAVGSARYTIDLPAPSFTVTGTALTLIPGGTTGNTSTISLTPSGGFTGVVSLSCAISPFATNDPATCSLPGSVTISGTAAQTATLTVYTTAARASLRSPQKLFWQTVGGTTVACFLVALFPARRRRWKGRLGYLAVLLCISSGLLACGGGGSGDGGGSGGGNPGTTAGAYTITVTGTSGTVTQTGTVALTVE